MTIQSKEAYRDGGESRTTKANALARIIHFNPSGLTLPRLCELTGWPTNVVSARLSELSDLGLIKEHGSQGTHTLWVESDSGEIAALQKKRMDAKRKNAEVQAVMQLHGQDAVIVTVKVSGEDWRKSKKRVFVA